MACARAAAGAAAATPPAFTPARSQASAAPSPTDGAMGLQCGAAVRDITPSYAVSLHGYAARDRLSDDPNERSPDDESAPHEPITLGVLCLSTDDTRVLIVTADMVGMSARVCSELYSLLDDAVGITFPNVLLSCSHTHFAPALQPADCQPLPEPLGNEPDPRFVDDVKRKLVEAAQEAVRTLQPATMETARPSVGALAYNRRWPTSDGTVAMHLQYPLEDVRRNDDTLAAASAPLDDELTILRFRAAATTGKEPAPLLAALLNWGCHPVTGGRDSGADGYRVSADYPHYARETIAAAWHCPTFFSLGAAGDAVPIQRYDDSRERIGTALGLTALLAERAFTTEHAPSLQAVSPTVEPRSLHLTLLFVPACSRDSECGFM